MRISSVTLHRIRIPFKTSFVHALKSRSEADTLILRLTSSDGVTGIGEILPRPYLTGEHMDSILAMMPGIASYFVSRSFEDRDDLVAALHDQLQRCGRLLA